MAMVLKIMCCAGNDAVHIGT